jgi:uncharacterized protein (DUF433 family)
MDRDRIARAPDVMLGKPVIAGTRITVELILRKCAAGMSATEIVADYPGLAEEDIRAALEYAADYMEHESILAAE